MTLRTSVPICGFFCNFMLHYFPTALLCYLEAKKSEGLGKLNDAKKDYKESGDIFLRINKFEDAGRSYYDGGFYVEAAKCFLEVGMLDNFFRTCGVFILKLSLISLTFENSEGSYQKFI